MRSTITKPIEFFRADPNNPRKSFPEDELRLLGASVAKKQLLPLIARNSGILVDGERRWRAAKLVGLNTLDCYLVDDTATEGEIKEIQLVTALHRADLKPYEVYLGFVEWLRSHAGKTGKDLAAAIDRSEAAVSMTLSLHRCIPVVKEAAKEGKIGLKDWYALSQCGEQQQAEMLAAKLNGKRDGSTVRAANLKCLMPSGVTVTLARNGEGITLDDVIETLAELLKAAKKANDDGLDSKTFSAVLKDKAKAK